MTSSGIITVLGKVDGLTSFHRLQQGFGSVPRGLVKLARGVVDYANFFFPLTVFELDTEIGSGDEGVDIGERGEGSDELCTRCVAFLVEPAEKAQERELGVVRRVAHKVGGHRGWVAGRERSAKSIGWRVEMGRV